MQPTRQTKHPHPTAHSVCVGGVAAPGRLSVFDSDSLTDRLIVRLSGFVRTVVVCRGFDGWRAGWRFGCWSVAWSIGCLVGWVGLLFVGCSVCGCWYGLLRVNSLGWLLAGGDLCACGPLLVGKTEQLPQQTATATVCAMRAGRFA